MPYSLRTSSRSSTIPGPDPFRTAPGAYVWNPLDDVFIAVSQWNRTHSGSTPKIIQLLLNAGFNAPGWVFTNIDRSVCGGRANCTGSCDGLFMTPLPPVSSHCGYTTIFYRTESTPIPCHGISPTQAQIELEGCPQLNGDCVGSGGGRFLPSEGLQNVLSSTTSRAHRSHRRSVRLQIR